MNPFALSVGEIPEDVADKNYTIESVFGESAVPARRSIADLRRENRAKGANKSFTVEVKKKRSFTGPGEKTYPEPRF